MLSQGNKLNTQDKLAFAKELAASSQFDKAIKIIIACIRKSDPSMNRKGRVAVLLVPAETVGKDSVED